MTAHRPTTTTIAILGGNTVVGHALALLLRGVGYETRSLEAPPTGLVENLLEGVDLLLVMPGLDNERREESLAILRAAEGSLRVPVLELTSITREGLATGATILAPWPFGIDGLAREIEAALRVADPVAENVSAP